jgi:hypothetical protein
MYNPSKGRPAGMWEKGFDFSQPLSPSISPAHPHEFGIGYDLQYKDQRGKIQAKLDGLRPDEAAFLRRKHGL